MRHVSPRCFRLPPLAGAHCVLFEQPGLRKGVPAQIDLAKLPSRLCDSMIITLMESHIKGNCLKIQPFVDLCVSFSLYLFLFLFNFHFEVLNARKLGMSEYDINHHRKQQIAILGLNIFKFLEIQDRCALPISSDMAEKKSTPCFLAKH